MLLFLNGHNVCFRLSLTWLQATKGTQLHNYPFVQLHIARAMYPISCHGYKRNAKAAEIHLQVPYRPDDGIAQ